MNDYPRNTRSNSSGSLVTSVSLLIADVVIVLVGIGASLYGMYKALWTNDFGLFLLFIGIIGAWRALKLIERLPPSATSGGDRVDY